MRARTVVAVGVALSPHLGLASGPPACPVSAGAATSRTIRSVCRELRRELGSIPGASVKVAQQVAFLDERAGCVRKGCVVKVTGSYSALGPGSSPEGIPERYLADKGWTALLTYAADGPDGTAYAMYRAGAICLVRGESSHWHDEQGSHQDDSYSVSVSCGHAAGTAPE